MGGALVEPRESDEESIIGAPLSRVDGAAKVTGKARYSAEIDLEGVAYACLVQSTIAKGSIETIESDKAMASPGVLAVMTHENAPALNRPEKNPRSMTIEERLPLQDNVIHYAGQHVALIVADTLERAAYAASLVRVVYKEDAPTLDMEKGMAGSRMPEKHTHTTIPMQFSRGDGEKAFDSPASDVVRVDGTYIVPVEHHNPMEPSASTASWEGDRLMIYDSTQSVIGARDVLSRLFGIPPENVRVISHFVGGGFGSKGNLGQHPVLAAMAARAVGRPVKLVVSRKQLFSATGHRPTTIQKVSLVAKGTGKLVAIRHEVISQTSFVGEFFEPSGAISALLYASPSASVTHTAVPVNIAPPTYMRAPGEASGSFALESAMDELAYQLKMDPIKLRMVNYAPERSAEDKPWSGKHLDECYDLGAAAFHWNEGRTAPRPLRDGRFLVGVGMATAVYHAGRMPASARVRIFPDGRALVSTASQDIGTGTYTIIAQVAADTLGIPIEDVRSELGDSALPPSPRSAGSMTTASVTPAVKDAALAARKKLIELAARDKGSKLHGRRPDEVYARDGRLFAQGAKSSGTPFGEVIGRHNLPYVQGDASFAPGKEEEKFSFYSFGAHFAEVKVDLELGEVRVSRFLGVYDTGTTINAKTAHSQMIGGIVWGIGMALMEETHYDQIHGRVINSNLADYLVPVNADVPHIDVKFLDKPDREIGSMGARGIGEISITGAAAAIANAVYNATGIRVRDLPITPDKLLRAGP